MDRKPSFFLVGAPKSGTTTIYQALSQHPEIYLPKHKELHYFASDLYPTEYITEQQYNALFNNAKSEKILGEASVWYLYSDVAAKSIKNYCPNAKILIMLRKPVEMLSSLHAQYVFDNVEQYTDFETALDMEDERKRGALIKSSVYNKASLLYSNIVRYHDYVKVYYDTFGKKNVKIILFDEFSKNTISVVQSTYEFLNVNKDYMPDINIENKRKIPKNHLLKSLMNPPYRIKNIFRQVLPFSLRRNFLEKLIKFNTIKISKTDIDLTVQKRIRNICFDDVNELAVLIDRDLSGWQKY